jgi:hypothetical protein
MLRRLDDEQARNDRKPRAVSSGPHVVYLAASILLCLTAIPSQGVTANSIDSKGAGGKAIAHHANAEVIRSKTIAAKAPRIQLSRIGLNSTEPTIGMTNDGTVLTSAFQSNTRIEVMRSTDRGKSWELVSPQIGGRNTQLLSLDPYTYVDNRLGDADSSRVFTIDLTVACAYLSFSDDSGDTWTTNPLACGRPVNDHQTLFSGPSVSSPTVGYPNIVYYCWNDVLTSSCTKSLDGGLTFSATGQPAFPGPGSPVGCGGLTGHGFVGNDGTALLPSGVCGQPWLAISADEGTTWNRVQVASNGTSDHEADAVIDAKGNIYYTWVGQDRLPYLAVSKDGGNKWSRPMMIAPPGVEEANLPAMDVGGNGKIAISYMGSENSRFAPGGAQVDYSATTWNAYITISANADSKVPIFYTTTVNNKKDPLVRGTCGPGRCQAVYDFIDIVIDRGEVWGAYVDGCTGPCIEPGATQSSGSEGITGRLVGGPSLR